MTDFLHAHCTSHVSAMDAGQIQSHLAASNSWQLRDGAIEKTFPFANFHETMAFVNALAWISHTEDHHAELAVSADRCVVRYRTQSVSGITANDFICAAKVDSLVAFIG